ncbi:MAG TPA: twin-arginine translocase TatA/TatE family subunit [Candidatus Kapabacteria bacterium]
MFKNFGAFEIILIVALILLLFGGKKIPELMRGLGQGMNEFKKSSKGDGADKPADDTTPKP